MSHTYPTPDLTSCRTGLTPLMAAVRQKLQHGHTKFGKIIGSSNKKKRGTYEFTLCYHQPVVISFQEKKPSRG